MKRAQIKPEDFRPATTEAEALSPVRFLRLHDRPGSPRGTRTGKIVLTLAPQPAAGSLTRHFRAISERRPLERDASLPDCV